MEILSAGEAARRTALDRGLLMARTAALSEPDLLAPQEVPLGDFCESLRDLVAHVLMWDEINLAVLTEARLGRSHWSLQTQWEQPEAGNMLNRAGVAAGRELPIPLLINRFGATRDALLDELGRYDEETWRAPLARAESAGWLAQYVMTVPRNDPYWHAAIHLNELASVDR